MACKPSSRASDTTKTGSVMLTTVNHDGCDWVVAQGAVNGEGVALHHHPFCSNPAHEDDPNEFSSGIQLTKK